MRISSARASLVSGLCIFLSVKPDCHPHGDLGKIPGFNMAPGNKTKPFKNNVTAKRRPANSASGTKKKRRGKKKAKVKSDGEQSVRCVSPLVYNPEASVQELMQKYGKETKEIQLKDLYEYQSDPRQKNQRVSIRMGLSNHISRFEIPMDVKLLESMTVQEYLRQYCHVCKRRQKYYSNFFDKYDKDKDGFLSFKETECALNNIYFDEIHPGYVSDLMTTVAMDENTSLDIKLFFSLCALSERFFYTSFVKQDTDKYEEKQWLEAADFSAIKYKVADLHINDELRNLLDSLVYTT